MSGEMGFDWSVNDLTKKNTTVFLLQELSSQEATKVKKNGFTNYRNIRCNAAFHARS